MGALKKRALEAAAEGESVRSPLERAVDEAEQDLAEGHAVEHDEVREKLRRWANGDA